MIKGILATLKIFIGMLAIMRIIILYLNRFLGYLKI